MSMEKIFRSIPRVDDLLAEPILENYSRVLRLKAIRYVLETFRNDFSQKETFSLSLEELRPYLIEQIIKQIKIYSRPALRKVINGTGIILHTGLGRAPLAKSVRESLQIESQFMMLEINQETGQRGVREASISSLLCELTGAESATVVNNNAAATLIGLSAFAKGKEVIVSRGQMVEIGGSFRIPSVMEQSGAILKEVGCTNKTHLVDYERTISENTGLLLEVHTSNYRIMGFSESVSTEELVSLGAKKNIPVMYDMGSGNLVDLKPYGVLDEPTVQDKLKSGIDLITFSGDKLLGGPQAGILVGKKKWIQEIRKNPLFRAIRPGKLDLIALERTLQIYLNEDNPLQKIPTLQMLTTPLEKLHQRACKLLKNLQNKLSPNIKIEIREEPSQMGSGSLPTTKIPSVALALRWEDISANKLSKKLRMSHPPLFNCIRDNWVLLNLRTIFEEEDELLLEILEKL